MVWNTYRSENEKVAKEETSSPIQKKVGESPKHTNPANGWNLYSNFGYFWDGTATWLILTSGFQSGVISSVLRQKPWYGMNLNAYTSLEVPIIDSLKSGDHQLRLVVQIPFLTVFYTSQVVQEFFHQQFHLHEKRAKQNLEFFRFKLLFGDRPRDWDNPSSNS